MNESPHLRSERNPTYEILLGVAVLGILLLNIKTFGLTAASLNQLIVNPHGGNYWLLTITNALFGNKFLALLCMLFGASIVSFFAKTKAINGISVPDLFIRRQLWLLLIGIFTAIVMLWEFDILFHLGMIGVFLFPLQRLSVRNLLIGALLMGLIYSGKAYWSFSESKTKYEKFQQVTALEKKNKKVKLTDEQKDDKSAWEGMVKQSKYDKKADQKEIKAIRSDYTDVWSHLLGQAQWKEAKWTYQTGLWDIASLMLLGMALFKLGFFSNALNTKEYAIMALGGLIIGQAIAWYSLSSYELKIVDLTKYVSGSIIPTYDFLLPFERAFTAIGLAGLVMLLYRSGTMAWLWKALGAVGRLALSNYLLQAIICTLVFYGYGMSFFGELTFYQLYFILIEIWIIQIVFSIVWLKFFQYGPAEWLWRSLVLWQRQPMQQSESVESINA